MPGGDQHGPPDGTPAHPDCIRAVQQTATMLEQLGHSVEEADPTYPHDELLSTMTAFMAVPLALAVDDRLIELGRELHDGDLEPFTRFLYEAGRQYSGSQLAGALRDIEQVGRTIGSFFETYDILVTPTIAEPVPLLGHLDTTSVDAMFQHAGTHSAFTSFLNMTGQPALSLPLATDARGLPIGVQFVAALGREDLLLRMAGQIESAGSWSTEPAWPPHQV